MTELTEALRLARSNHVSRESTATGDAMLWPGTKRHRFCWLSMLPNRHGRRLLPVVTWVAARSEQRPQHFKAGLDERRHHWMVDRPPAQIRLLKSAPILYYCSACLLVCLHCRFVSSSSLRHFSLLRIQQPATQSQDHPVPATCCASDSRTHVSTGARRI